MILVSKQVSLAVSTPGCPFESICVYQSFTRIAHAPTPAHSLHLLCACTCVATHPVRAIHSFQCFIRIIVKIPHTDWGFRADFLRRQPTRLLISSHSFLSVSIRLPPFIPFSLSSGSSSRFHTLIRVSKRVSHAVSPSGCPF